MASHDPLGDMIAMIKNANTRGIERVEIPHSQLKEGVARTLLREGFVADVRVVEVEGRRRKQRSIHVFLKEDVESGKVLVDLKRVSKPGRRIYRGIEDLGKVQDGLGIWVLSTSQGVLSDREARTKRTGGEVLCKAW